MTGKLKNIATLWTLDVFQLDIYNKLYLSVQDPDRKLCNILITFSTVLKGNYTVFEVHQKGTDSCHIWLNVMLCLFLINFNFALKDTVDLEN